jgi:ribonuclease E
VVSEPAARVEQASDARVDAKADAAASEAPARVPLVDLPPVAPTERRRTVRPAEAEVLLDSVLDALPAPKKAGEGRTRSRRVSTAALSTAGTPPVITRVDGTTADAGAESGVER